MELERLKHGDVSITGGAKMMPASSALYKTNGDVTIGNDIVVTNNGIFSIDGSVIGSNAGSSYINAANATLSVAGSLLSTGTLVSNANNNTVNYTGSSGPDHFPC